MWLLLAGQLSQVYATLARTLWTTGKRRFSGPGPGHSVGDARMGTRTKAVPVGNRNVLSENFWCVTEAGSGVRVRSGISQPGPHYQTAPLNVQIGTMRQGRSRLAD